MRQPTPDEVSYRWYRAALSGQKPPVHDGEPQCGFYRRKLVKGGPWVPAMIYLVADIDPDTGDLMGDEDFACLIDGRQADARDQWSWLCSNPIPYPEYRDLERQANVIRRTRHSDPAFDLLTVPPPSF